MFRAVVEEAAALASVALYRHACHLGANPCRTLKRQLASELGITGEEAANPAFAVDSVG